MRFYPDFMQNCEAKQNCVNKQHPKEVLDMQNLSDQLQILMAPFKADAAETKADDEPAVVPEAPVDDPRWTQRFSCMLAYRLCVVCGCGQTMVAFRLCCATDPTKITSLDG